MTEQEKIEFEKEIRQKVLMERRAAKAEWRKNNKESIRKSNTPPRITPHDGNTQYCKWC